MMFANRTEAGKRLAMVLEKYSGTNTIVLAIPRGGVPVAHEISSRLNLPLDLVLAKKIGHPRNEEYAIGSVSLDAVITEKHPDVPEQYVKEKTEQLQRQLADRMRLFRGEQHPPELRGKNVIVVDDGIATGNTMLACIQTLRKMNPAKIIVAVPVSPKRGCTLIRAACDEFISLEEPDYFPGVGAFYRDFTQVSDDVVKQLLPFGNKS